MSQYCSGAFIPKQKRTYLLAKALNINEAWLMGYDDVAMDRKKDDFERASDYYNASAVLAKKFAPGTTESEVSDVEMIAVKATEKQWTYILNKLSQENRDKLQEQAELLLLKQQVQADKEEK